MAIMGFSPNGGQDCNSFLDEPGTPAMRAIHISTWAAIAMGMTSVASADVVSFAATFADSPARYFGPNRVASTGLSLAGFDASLGHLDSVRVYFSAHQVASIDATFQLPGFYGAKWQTDFTTDLVANPLPSMTASCIMNGFSLPPAGSCTRSADISEALITSLADAMDLAAFISNSPLSFNLGYGIVAKDNSGGSFGGVSQYFMEVMTISKIRVEYVYTQGTTAVPEPHAAGLVGLGMAALFLLRGRPGSREPVEAAT